MSTLTFDGSLGLKYYYKMDAITNGQVPNIINPEDFSLTVNGAPAVVTGRINNALNLTEDADYLDRGTSATFWTDPAPSAGDAAFTVGAWVNFNSIEEQPFSTAKQVVIMEGVGSSETTTIFQMGVDTDTSRPFFLSAQSDNTVRIGSAMVRSRAGDVFRI